MLVDTVTRDWLESSHPFIWAKKAGHSSLISHVGQHMELLLHMEGTFPMSNERTAEMSSGHLLQP